MIKIININCSAQVGINDLMCGSASFKIQTEKGSATAPALSVNLKEVAWVKKGIF